MTGTMKVEVTRSRSMRASTSSASKWSLMTRLAPSVIIMRANAGAALW